MFTAKADTLLQTFLVLATVALGVVFWDSVRDKVVTVGDTAPDFEIQTDSGMTLTRSHFGGKVLVINFWATWCPPCVKETPDLESVYKTLGDSGVVILGVSVDKNQQNYDNFKQRFGVTYQMVRDPEAKVADRFGTYRYPETYVINSDGKVLMKVIGADWTVDSMTQYLKSML